nr:ATP-grasp fold amidoligase family protein [Modestobacter versicolor]
MQGGPLGDADPRRHGLEAGATQVPPPVGRVGAHSADVGRRLHEVDLGPAADQLPGDHVLPADGRVPGVLGEEADAGGQGLGGHAWLTAAPYDPPFGCARQTGPVPAVSLPDGVVTRLPLRLKRAVLFRAAHGRWPGRTTFTDKVNWRVVHDRRPLVGQLGDKLAMKAYATAVCPSLRVPAVLWSGTDVGAFAAAPDLPARWVLKPNHGSMRVHVGTGRPDAAELRRVTAGWLDEPLFRTRGEWVYSQARRLLLAEEFLGAGDPPADHKFLVFDGRVELVQVDTGRFGDHRRRLYTPDWTPVDVVEAVPAGPVTPPPASLPRMLEVAATLGAAFDFVRVDLYDVDGEVWFSELTPYPGGGLDAFDPVLDERLGAAWRLPPHPSARSHLAG